MRNQKQNQSRDQKNQARTEKTFLRFQFLTVLCLCFIALPSVCLAKPAEKCKVGYGFSNYYHSPLRQEQFLIGFKYGLKRSFDIPPKFDGPCSKHENIELIVQGAESRHPFGAAVVAQKLIDQDVLLLAGFPSSHEALLAAKVAKENNIAVVIDGAINSLLAEYAPYILTTSPGTPAYAEAMVEKLTESQKPLNFLYVAENDNIYSIDFLKGIQKRLGEINHKVNLQVVDVSKRFEFSEEQLEKIDFKNLDVIYLSLYPPDTKKLLVQIFARKKPKTKLVVSASWLTFDLAYFVDIGIENKKHIGVIGFGIPNEGKPILDTLVKNFEKDMGMPPRSANYHGYEVGIVVGSFLKRLKSKSRAEVLQILRSNLCHETEPYGKFCRKNNGFTDKKIRFFRWQDNNFVLHNEMKFKE